MSATIAVRHECRVHGRAPEVYAALRDLRLVARSLPGAGETEVVAGALRVTLDLRSGPADLSWEGTVAIGDADGPDHSLQMRACGDGPSAGTDAVIDVTVVALGPHSLLRCATTLVAGPGHARPAPSRAQEFVSRFVYQFACNLEAALPQDGSVPDRASPDGPASSTRPPGPSGALRLAALVAGPVVAGLVLWALTRRRRSSAIGSPQLH